MVRTMNIRVEACNELSDPFIVGVGYPVEGSLSAILPRGDALSDARFSPPRDRDAEDFIQQHFPVATPAAAGKAAAFWPFLHQELRARVFLRQRLPRIQVPASRSITGASAWVYPPWTVM